MLSRAFLSLVANMASFLRKEIQAAIREEVSHVMNSTATRTATNSTSTLSTGATAAENSRNSSNSAPSSIQQSSSECTLSFEEFDAHNWHSFLRSVSRGKLKCNVIPYPRPGTGDTSEPTQDNSELRILTLSDVLQFGSGSRFPNFVGKLEFDHECTYTNKRIKGNACGFGITIPVNTRYMCDSNQFAQNLME